MASFAVDDTSIIRYHQFTGHPEIVCYFFSGFFFVMTSLPNSPAQQEQKPDPDERKIPIPAVPRSSGTAESQRGRGLGAVFMILVLTLAFLAASFPARNSDLWFHLATGRLLANREFSFGSDPFAYTTQVYWACHSWLFDGALFAARGWIGDAGLVVLKAVLVMALAALLMRIRRPDGATWLPAVCTMLAILAMSPRLLLQPACVSYFLLGLTFWLLWRSQAKTSSYFILPLVFILWVNVDEWFLLGPLLVALFWLGEWAGGQRRTPGWLVPVGLAACLLNPYTYHAFTPPAELSIVPWTSGLRLDPRIRTAFASPWETEYLHAAMRLNAAVLAYYVLTLLGLASFVLHRPALRDWRLLVWLTFAVLAGWQARLIPFFAVVAAPIMALNGQDILNARYAETNTRNRFVLGMCSLALLLVLPCLIALTWMGWLAGYDREERHVAWEVQEDSSLRQAAETLDQWRRQGLLPEGEHVMALAPEVAQYCAFFCRGEKQFFDHRYPLFPHAAREYETVCRALLSSSGHDAPPAKDSDKQRPADWQRVLRDHKVGIVIFYDRDPRRLFAVLNRLAGEPENWTLLHVAGQALIAGWNKARPSGGFDSLAFDADRLAFGPKDEHQTPPAPEQGPAQLPKHRDFWARLAGPPASPSWESAAAAAYLQFFHVSEAAQRQRQYLLSLRGYAASLAGLPAQPSAVIQAAFQLASSEKLLYPEADSQYLVRKDLGPFFADLVDRSPALPLLAVRAARRAVAADPEDATAWLRLGQAYLLLRNFTCERTAEGLLPPLAQLRHVQIVTALEQALRLDPDLEDAHRELAYLYGESNSLDQSLEHRREEIRLTRKAGPRPGETKQDFNYRLEPSEKELARQVELVDLNRKKYASISRSPQGDRVMLARRVLSELGLAKLAADEILLTTPADVLSAPGIRLELDLLLSLGRLPEVRDILNNRALRASKHGLEYSDLPPPADPDKEKLYRKMPYHCPAYEWLHVLASAAAGDYAACREDLRVIRASLQARQEQVRQRAIQFEHSTSAFLPALVTGPSPFLPAFISLAVAHAVEEKAAFDAEQQTLLAQQADVCVIEGLLALEQGDVDAARSAFAEAQKLGADMAFAGRPIAAGYLGKLAR
jgi:tetratricopeptide (TPR) repeat protein